MIIAMTILSLAAAICLLAIGLIIIYRCMHGSIGEHRTSPDPVLYLFMASLILCFLLIVCRILL